MLSRFHLLRAERADAARAAVRMREDLLRCARPIPPAWTRCSASASTTTTPDVLPRLAKVLRFLARMPGGDRERGLARIESAGDGSLFHDDEVQAQLYEIYAFYEKSPDARWRRCAACGERHPGWPLWALKLAEHLRDRMGLYAESAGRRARGAGRGPEGPGQLPGGRVPARAPLLGESLLLDLRFADARRELLLAKDGPPEIAAALLRGRLLLGRCLEQEATARSGRALQARGHLRRSRRAPPGRGRAAHAA